MRVLIAEDERLTRLKLRRQLEKMGHEVVEACDGQEAWDLFQAQTFPIVVSDWEMPNLNGVELVRKIRSLKSEHYVYIVMLTGKSEKKDVVEGIEAGADDFVSKPFDRDELRARFNAGRRIVELEQNLASANGRLRHELAVARELSDVEHRKHEEVLLGGSIPIRSLREGIQLHASNDGPLRLVGPPGAGHEAVARAIHRNSTRRSRAFIYVDCAHVSAANQAIFGFQMRSQQEGRSGKAALADGGTLYLEGVETLSETSRDQLATFLKESANIRSKGERPDPDVRVIAYVSSSEQDADPVQEHDDNLEFLLNQNRLSVPSLAERKEDIPVIADRILKRRASSVGKALEGLSNEAIDRLTGYSWPGNIRELHSVLERSIMLATGTLLDIPEELVREGRRVGGYTLRRRLGQGGMGEVWLAQHSLLARPAAVKLIRQSSLKKDADAKEMLEERFEREAMATAQLRSPHTVELYDFGVTDDGDFFYVMEYLSGTNLHSLVLKHGPIPVSRAIFLLTQACVSLHEAHLAQMVHRDIKPANLFICRLGTQYDFLKLLDFGIVRSAKGTSDTSSANEVIKGSPTTMSPEVLKGQNATHLSDIYGLGCVAYWLLTGHHVFEAPNVMSMLFKHSSEQPKAPSVLTPGLPKELDELILRCLAKDPADRPTDAQELAEQLLAIPIDASWDNQQAKQWWEEAIPEEDDSAEMLDTSLEIRPDTKASGFDDRSDDGGTWDWEQEASSGEDADRDMLESTQASDSEAFIQQGESDELLMSFADGTLSGRADDWLGRRLGEFEVTRLLGIGETGLVLRARDRRLDRNVAIKVLSDELSDDSEVLEQFLAEARLVGQLNHPNIVTIYDVVQDGSLSYLVLEFVAGGSAQRHLNRQGAYSPGDATRILIDACKGLSAAHKAGLVHREVNPSNLLLTSKGVAKVSDFGMAKQTDGVARNETLAGQAANATYFFSPEQLKAMPVDARSDIYCLGATYYSLLTGRPPFEGNDPTRLLMEQLDSDPPDPRDVDASIPEVCSQIIEQAMAKAPEQRYQSAADLMQDLEAVMMTISIFRAP